MFLMWYICDNKKECCYCKQNSIIEICIVKKLIYLFLNNIYYILLVF